MTLASDVIKYIEETFSEPEQFEALSLLKLAEIHDGSLAESRLQRCASIASGGSLKRLQHYVALLKVDYRDVILAGEYENVAGELVHVRDLNSPIQYQNIKNESQNT